MSERKLAIGVDGGGTKTLGVLIDGSERELARAAVPSSNIHSNPHPVVERILQDLVRDLCQKASVEVADLDSICLGMAGCDSPHDRAVLQGFLRPILSEKTSVTIINDAIVAARAVLGRLHGLLLIAGTGSICFGWNDETGEKARCGGWGHLLSDEGSGYLIGLEGLRAVLQGVDGRGPKTSLEHILLGHFGYKEPRDILQFIYGAEGTKANVANLARYVIQEDEKGDAAAGGILDRQADELVRLITPVYQKLFEGAAEPINLGLWGGNLVHGDRYRQRLLDRLGETGLNLNPVIAPDAEAVHGAAKHALMEVDTATR